MEKVKKKKYNDLRSSRWFGPDDLRSFGHRSRMLQMGYDPSDWKDKPVIAIINTWSGINPCHAHFRHRADDVQRGVFQSGGFPIELPAMSLSEPFVKPTTMLYRNLLAMEVEELIRSHPVDGAVLMGGCDKTTPGLIMGAISAGLPMIFLPAGPMLRGNYKGQTLGSGSDTWKYWDERRAGNISSKQWGEVEAGIARSYGHCMTMGTASTMTAIADAMGLCLPGASSIPAPDANHMRMSVACGRRIVDMVWEDTSPKKIIKRASCDNAAVVAMSMGCSTNAVIHLVAMARRAGINFCLDDLDAVASHVPVIANIRPSGASYLMEDFFYAGGLLGLMSRLKSKLDLNALTVSGDTWGKILKGATVFDDDIIREIDKPIYADGSLAVLKGNLSPDGCVIKPSACDPRFFNHQGPALVYDTYPEMKAAIEDENLEVTPDHILVFRGAGPQGGPGMPEWGMLPIPKKLIKEGVRDMLRISDARMSGTSYGACILHVTPEAYIGGPIAFLKTGDIIKVDIPNRSIDMMVSEKVIAERRDAWVQPNPKFERGYGWMFSKHIKQANEGCDFDYLQTDFGDGVGEPDIF